MLVRSLAFGPRSHYFLRMKIDRRDIFPAPLIVSVGLFLLTGCGSSNRTATCFYSSVIEKMALPVISFEAANFIAGGKPRLDVMFQIPLKNLKFQKEANIYTAKYSVAVRITDSQEKQVASEEWTKTVTVGDYRQTLGGNRDATLRVFVVPPGKYTLTVTILDEYSQQQCEARKNINIRQVAGPFNASDIVLLQKITEEHGIKTITPMFSEDIGRVRSFSTFMEVYDSVRTDTLRVSTKVVSFHYDYDKHQQSSPYPFTSYAPQLERFTPRFDSVVARSDTNIISDGLPTPIFNTLSVPPAGRYQLLTVVTKVKPGNNDTLAIGKTLTVRPEYFPDVNDIDGLIEPLRYIAKKDEFDSLMAPARKEERGRRLEDFWNTTLDPALRQEFYSRVRQANEYFTSIVDGWRTPMGMVYIIAGPPAEFECMPGRSETWYYDYQQGYAPFVFQTNPLVEENDRSLYLLTGYPSENVWSTFVYRWRR